MLTQESLLCVNTKLWTMELLESVICFPKMKEVKTLLFNWMLLLISTDSLKHQAASTGRRAGGAGCITASPSSAVLKPRSLTGMAWAWLAWGSQWAGSPWEGTFQPYFCNLLWKKVRSPRYNKKNATFQSQFFLTLFYRKKFFFSILKFKPTIPFSSTRSQTPFCAFLN